MKFRIPFQGRFFAPAIGFVLLLVAWIFPRPIGLMLTVAGGVILARRACVSPDRADAGPGPLLRRDADMTATLERLYGERQRLSNQVEELSAGREISLAVGSIIDFDEMIQAILALVTSHFGVSKAIIYLRASEEEWFEVVGARIFETNISPSKVIQRRVKIGVGLIGCAAAERREIIESKENKGVIAAVPLIIKDKVVGVLKLSDSDSDAFTPEKRRKLHSVSGAIAVALENSRLYRMAVVDGLTGLYVHRHFQMRLKEEFERSMRHGSALSLLMLDIDHFKKFNDTYGHQTGDKVLRGVAAILTEEARGMDVVCRYGGEEMAIICPETDIEGATNLAERIRAHIEGHQFESYEDDETRSGEPVRVTVSVGISCYGKEIRTRAELIERADEALYAAKHGGRNCVRCHSAETSHEGNEAPAEP